MKRVVLLTVALALLPAVAAAHDTGPDPTDAHAQIVAVQGNRLYLGSYGRGMHIYDGSDPRAPRRIGAYTPGLWADAPPDAIDYRGRRFAVLNGTRRTHSSLPPDARTDRTEWLDVTHAAAPRLLHTFGPDQVGASCCWPRAATTSARATRAACSSSTSPIRATRSSARDTPLQRDRHDDQGDSHRSE